MRLEVSLPTRRGFGLGEGVVGDCDLLEVDLLLAIDGLLLADEDILEFEGALALQRTAGELLTLGVLGTETQVDTFDNHVGPQADGRLDVVGALALDGGTEGAQAVAEEHFNKDAKDLTRSECALIAATLPNPRKFSSKSPSSYMLKRQSRILKEMKFVGEFPMK